MSRIAELTQEVNDLQNRVTILESALVRLLEKTNIQDLSSDMIRVEDSDDFEARTRIGYKPTR